MCGCLLGHYNVAWGCVTYAYERFILFTNLLESACNNKKCRPPSCFMYVGTYVPYIFFRQISQKKSIIEYVESHVFTPVLLFKHPRLPEKVSKATSYS